MLTPNRINGACGGCGATLCVRDEAKPDQDELAAEAARARVSEAEIHVDVDERVGVHT